METSDKILLHWSTGAAELNLAAWFPCPKWRLPHLRKLLALDPEAAPGAVEAIKQYILMLMGRTAQQEKTSYTSWETYKRRLVELDTQLEYSTFPDGSRITKDDRQLLKTERAGVRKLLDRAAATNRRAHRDHKMLRQNLEAVKSWGSKA